MTHSPVVTRRRLGSELRRLCDASGRRLEEAAAALECSSAKISRLETGKGFPKNGDIRDLIRPYIAGPMSDLLTLGVERRRQEPCAQRGRSAKSAQSSGRES